VSKNTIASSRDGYDRHPDQIELGFDRMDAAVSATTLVRSFLNLLQQRRSCTTAMPIPISSLRMPASNLTQH